MRVFWCTIDEELVVYMYMYMRISELACSVLTEVYVTVASMAVSSNKKVAVVRSCLLSISLYCTSTFGGLGFGLREKKPRIKILRL